MAKINKNEENITLADIVENEEDKKILEPVEVSNDIRDNRIGKVIKVGTVLKKEPTRYSEPVTILGVGTVVMIDASKETFDYFMVTADGCMGYVLKENIAVAD